MIKIKRGCAPICLTNGNELLLLENFKQTGRPVWNKKEIKQRLVEDSCNKCAYCECEINVESYMQIDHFKCKSKYPDLVVNWENLIPSCNQCNNNKRDHDVVLEPIINPYENNPKEYLYVYNMRIMGRNEIGENTIDVLGLNCLASKLRDRAKLVLNMDEKISYLLQDIMHYKQYRDKKMILKIRSKIYGILFEAQPDKKYSYVMSATICRNKQFMEIKSELELLKEWDSKLDMMYQCSRNIYDPDFALEPISDNSP